MSRDEDDSKHRGVSQEFQDSAFDWQGREQITQLHICLNLTPTKYKRGFNTSSLRGQRLVKFYVKKKKVG